MLKTASRRLFGRIRIGNQGGKRFQSGGRLWFGGGFGWVFDFVFDVEVDSGEGTEQKAADVGEDGGAAGRDTILRDEVVEIAEGEVDALGGLEILRILEELGAKVFFDGLILAEASVTRAEGSVCGEDREAATGAVLEEVLTTRIVVDGIGVIGCGVHFGSSEVEILREEAVPLPRAFA